MNELIKKIDINSSYLINNSILGGRSGYILLLFSLKNYDKLYNTIKNILKDLNIQNESYLFSNGITGFLWVLNYINEDENIDYLDDVINSLNEVLFIMLGNKINNKLDFDFLHGQTGIIHYLVSYLKTEESNRYIKPYFEKQLQNISCNFADE